MLFLISITIIQLYIFIRKDLLNDYSKNTVKVENHFNLNIKRDSISLKELDEELNRSKGIKVISQEKDGDNWRCLVLLEGTCDNIISVLNNFTNYNIINYSIEGNKEKYLVNLEMIR